MKADRSRSRAVDLEPAAIGHRVLLAEVLTKAERPEAKVVEARIATIALWDPEALTGLVDYYERMGRPADAEAMLRKARDRRPRSTGTLSELAEFLQRQGRGDEAEATYRDALKVDSDEPNLLNGLGYLHAERGQKLEEGLKLIERALGREPGNWAFMDSKGRVLFRLGRLADAEDWLRRAPSPRVSSGVAVPGSRGGDPRSSRWTTGSCRALAPYRRSLAVFSVNYVAPSDRSRRGSAHLHKEAPR
jgi:Flp pilus assembly protein TadD